MTDTPNIHQHVAAICHTFELDPNFVAKIEITPRSLTATVYVPNENGAKHIDENTGEVAVDTKTYEVIA